MSLLIPFDQMFPVKANPEPADRVFGFDANGDVNAAFTLQAIINLLETTNPDWADIQNKPASFPPSAHTIGSHSNVSAGADSATEGQLLRRQGSNWAPWTPNFLTSFEESDPTVPSWVKAILAAQIANWDQAHSWGNHAGQYRPVDWVPTWAQVTGKPTSFTPSAHSLGSHSNVLSAVDSPSMGNLLRWNGTAWEAWESNFLDTSYTPPADATIPDYIRDLTLGQIASWDAKLLEYADFQDGQMPVIVGGAVQESGLRVILEENPYEEGTVEHEEFVAARTHIETDVPIKSPAGVDGNDLVRVDQIPNLTRYGLIAGGEVIWLQTGFEFKVLPASYVIQGPHSSEQTTVIGDEAHPTLPRKDAIGVNVLGEVIYKKGDAAEVPLVPYFDPETELILSSYDVLAGATTPDNITTTVIYNENTEWSGAFSGPGSANFASTAKPAGGAVSTEVSDAGNNSRVVYTAPTVVDLTGAATLVLELALKNTLFSGYNLSIGFLDENGEAASNFVILNLDRENLEYQTVGIALDSLIWTTKLVKGFVINFLRSRGAQVFAGYFIDNIRVQGGVTQPDTPSGSVPPHNQLPEIQGGTETERYHLPKNEHDAAINAESPSEENPYATISQIIEQLTAEEIKDLLETLTDEDRLDASAIKNLPSGGGGEFIKGFEAFGGSGSIGYTRTDPNANFLIFQGDGDAVLTGVASSADQNEGDFLFIYNDTDFRLSIGHETGGAGINSRFWINGSLDFIERRSLKIYVYKMGVSGPLASSYRWVSVEPRVYGQPKTFYSYFQNPFRVINANTGVTAFTIGTETVNGVQIRSSGWAEFLSRVTANHIWTGGATGSRFRCSNSGISPLLIRNANDTETFVEFVNNGRVRALNRSLVFNDFIRRDETRLYYLISITTSGVIHDQALTDGIFNYRFNNATEITGFAGGEIGRKITVQNDNTVDMTVRNQNTGSIANNRLNLIGATDLIIPSKGKAEFIFCTGNRWELSTKNF
jgi:hypothetical protein